MMHHHQKKHRSSGGAMIKGMKMKKKAKTSMISELPEDVIVEIIAQVAQNSPMPFADLYNLQKTCKMFLALSNDNIVKQRIALEREFSSLYWNAIDHRMDILNECANAGNAEGCFILALITIFEQKDISKGAKLLERAINKDHKLAIYVMKILHLQLQEHGVPTNVFSLDISKVDEKKICDDERFELCREKVLNIIRQVTWNKWDAGMGKEQQQCKNSSCGQARGWDCHRSFCSTTCQWNFEHNAFCMDM